MESEGNRARAFYAMMTVPVWRDPNCKSRFLTNPKTVLSEEGISIPYDVNIVAMEDMATIKYATLTPHAQGARAVKMDGLLERLLSIPGGNEVHLVSVSRRRDQGQLQLRQRQPSHRLAPRGSPGSRRGAPGRPE